MKTQSQNLYEAAEDHRLAHKCSAHPYRYANNLLKLLSQYRPHSVLEVGTGMGYMTAVFKYALPDAKITTIEKDPEHALAAQAFLKGLGINKDIQLIEGVAEEILPTLTDSFDCIFFDGFQIHYEFLPHYSRLLKPGGLLVIANNHLHSKTSGQFFEELNDAKQWKIVETFGDTTAALRAA